MTQRKWPTNSQYVEAVQHPSTCFSDAALRAGTIEAGSVLGLPTCATGQNAIVFPVHADGQKWAVRCFTTPATEGQRRYEAFSDYVSDLYCPAFVIADWLDQGILTDAGWWPIVKMEWIDGQPLQEVVKQLLGHPEQLIALAQQWREMVGSLRHVKVAHGDLQHGNILMDGAGALRLVDYDGIWLPTISELSTTEVGHPNYQHPERLATGYCDEYTDTFSALVIYTSLRALASDPTLWEFNRGENLIFRADDYVEPGVTDVWLRIARAGDRDVAALADLLATACRTTVKVPTDLNEILDTGRIRDALAYRPGNASPKWWDPNYEEAVAEAEKRSGHVKAEWGDDISDPAPEDMFDNEPEPDPGGMDPDPGGPDWRIVVIVVLLMIALAAAVIIVAVSIQH